ncbi:hypothetical protein BHE90_017586 [Fusarium euwallaceae]|uniref:Uncharacterized protein n=1 Tax=Fusarium euwallaceae TaxID=1147111 RepID=A0A430KX06_9HYPO|nr:hypothetical protein BHE90_017586 [Fusarium euwallaceae]
MEYMTQGKTSGGEVLYQSSGKMQAEGLYLTLVRVGARRDGTARVEPSVDSILSMLVSRFGPGCPGCRVELHGDMYSVYTPAGLKPGEIESLL